MDKAFALRCETIHELCGQLGSSSCIQVMEICGTHTMSIARSGLRTMLPENLRLVSGPGCPVCVTDQSYIDQSVALARLGEVTIATYGDMIRVPGRAGSLAEARAAGAQVEVVYSALDALELARRQPERMVVFLGVGFETTAPGTALAVLEAQKEGLQNFTVLAAHKFVLPAMEALMSAGDVRVDGFLCPGHVSVILGYQAYAPIAQKYGRPCVVAGFEADNVAAGLVEILRQLIDDNVHACTVYPSVSAEGNAHAIGVIKSVFATSSARWRALGTIPRSGMTLKPEFAQFDAAKRLNVPEMESYESPGCRCGDVICGRCHPSECGLFKRKCTPRDPVGPCMVSSEGACAAAFRYELK